MSDRSADIDIDYVANLARLALTDEEKVRYSAQLSGILGYFAKLSDVDVEGVKPSAHAFDLENVWQADEVKKGLSTEAALQNAPAQRDNQIIVPKVVDDA
jgi:aspartyl-tRNA(Asn)/glutamyl-tRNA(Gln) amidotransferase subunit C|tara:strand:- start:313 stop:612 length:300 start_codon:yes stop_codon:yes gene_type:complete